MSSLYEIREEMRSLVSTSEGDCEAAHQRADELLIAALRHMTGIVGGDPTLWPAEVEELIGDWERVPKWYA